MSPLEIELNRLTTHRVKLFESQLASASFGPKPWRLPLPRLCIMEAKRSRTIGGWYIPENWKQGAVRLDELVLTPEVVGRGVYSAAHVLVHEFVHLANHAAGRIDTSRQGRYHNKLFADTAHVLGLRISRHNTMGWKDVGMSAALHTTIQQICRTEQIKHYVFRFKRLPLRRNPRSLVRLECECVHFIYVTKSRENTTLARCDSCGELFQRESTQK